MANRTKSQIPNTKYQVPSTKYQVPNWPLLVLNQRIHDCFLDSRFAFQITRFLDSSWPRASINAGQMGKARRTAPALSGKKVQPTRDYVFPPIVIVVPSNFVRMNPGKLSG